MNPPFLFKGFIVELYQIHCPNKRKDNKNDTSINVEIP